MSTPKPTPAARRVGRRAVLAAAALGVPALGVPALAAGSVRAQPRLGRARVRRAVFDAALQHNVADLEFDDGGSALFLTYYAATGGLARWGHAISEPLIEDGRLAQYFQRGVMEAAADGPGIWLTPRLVWDFIGGGLDGSPDLGAETTPTNPFQGLRAGPFGHVVSNVSVGGSRTGFLDAFQRLGGAASLGYPKTAARVDTGAPGTLIDPTAEPGPIRQYFQAGVLEYASGQRQPARLRLLGDQVRNLAYPGGLWTLLRSFHPAPRLRPGHTVDLERLTRRVGVLATGHPQAPPGFTLRLLHDTADLGLPVSVAYAPDGRLFAAMSNNAVLWSAGEPGAQGLRVFAAGLGPLGVDEPRGLAFIGDAVYVSVRGAIVRLRDTSGSGAADEAAQIVSGLPERAHLLHRNNGLTVGPDGQLYVAIGSTSNLGEEPEEALSGSIIRLAPDGSRLERVAWGFRNPFDLAFSPEGDLFCTDNGPDVSERRLDDAPDELNHVIAGRHYGHPRVWGNPPAGSDTHGPAAALPAHAAVTGITFFTGPQAGEFTGDALVATWGPGQGRSSFAHNVLRVRLTRQGETFAGQVFPFAEGFDRPTDVTVSPRGDLVVSDHVGRRIYQLSRT